jgi:exosome complex RNA-binding protein Rrp42 (RNase PH superfamily)
MEAIALKALDPEEYLRIQLESGRRVDGRGFDEHRKLSINCKEIRCNDRILGSAVVALGWTKVISVITADEGAKGGSGSSVIAEKTGL